jgi:hypothetical protein
MTDLLQEFCDSRGVSLRVDGASGVIRGIKILGLVSRNGREYLPEALSRAVGLYEGAKVNVNHPKGYPLAPRDYQDRMGVIRNLQHRAGDGLFADFHFNPKHYLAEQLVWDAEHAPENVGFSHNVQARTSRHGETTLVEEIVRVHSVDLVADPATTRGLFESAATVAGTSANTSAVTELPGMEPADALPGAASNPAPCLPIVEQHSDVFQKLCHEQASEISRLQCEIDRLSAQGAAEVRRARALALLAEYQLPNPDSADAATKAIVSETFLQSLLSAPDESTMRRLVKERSRLVGSAKQWSQEHLLHTGRPTSRDQCTLDAKQVTDGRSFARAICS